MARRVKVSAGVLNIRLHPHTPERYLGFIQDIYRRKQAVKVHGDRYAMLSSLNRSEREENILAGVITTFVSVDSDGGWFDASSLSEATEEQISKINIPENLYPNAASYYFMMDGNRHRVYIETYSSGRALTITSAHRMFSRFSEDLRIVEKYGEAKISIVQDQAGLEALFKMPMIKELRITILRPNADIFADNFEEEVEAHLAQAQSKKLVIGYEAERVSSIVPTDDIRAASVWRWRMARSKLAAGMRLAR